MFVQLGVDIVDVDIIVCDVVVFGSEGFGVFVEYFGFDIVIVLGELNWVVL